MLEFLYNNVAVFLIVGIISFVWLWIMCNIYYGMQRDDLLNLIHQRIPGVFDPMLRFTENYGNIKFRGFIGLVIYLVLGFIDLVVEASWLNFLFSLFNLIGVFNSFTLITCLNKSLKYPNDLREHGRFMKAAYITLLIFRAVLYIAYISIFQF